MARRMSIGSSLSSAKEDENDSFSTVAVRRSIGGRKSIGSNRRRSFGSDISGSGSENTSPNQEAVREMYSKINDVIQLSSLNKITQKNAWNLGVNVDSIMESALDEGIVDKENEQKAKKGEVIMRRRRSGGFGRAGVNFQKASCKLDASVKIYSVRVDDTHASSYRILENLTRNSNTNNDQGDDAPKGQSTVGGKATSNKFGLTNTLEKNPDSQLNSATTQELHVDPSFHKMSHLFDEGGAGGMLLYNLHLQPARGCRIAFGDSVSAESETSEVVGGSAIIDISSLQTRVETAVNEMHPGTSLLDLPLVSELADLRREILESGLPQSSAASSSPPNSQPHDDAQDVLAEGSESEEDDEYNQGGGDGFDDSFGDDDNGMPFGFSSPSRSPGPSSSMGNMPMLDLLVDDEYAFFDMSRFSATNAWAGSSHWKFGKRKAHTKLDTTSEGAADASNAAPKSKARKGGLVVDFLLDDEALLSKLALPKANEKKGGKKGPSTSSTELTAAAMTKSEKNSFLLPEDAGVMPSDLGKLFLRPQKLRQSSRSVAHTNQASYMPTSPMNFASNDDGVCDDSFGDDNDYGGATADEDYQGDNQSPGASFKPFNMEDDIDEARMLAPERTVAKISVHHEVRAKRVDVRELKHQIWNDISSLCDKEADISESEEAATHGSESRQFSDVMDSVAETNDQKGVTLPFYFICVLHLANEKGLKLEGNDDLSNFTISADQQ